MPRRRDYGECITGETERQNETMNGKENPRAAGALNAIAAERAILAALLCGDDGGGETPLSRLAAISECALTERDFCDARHLPIFAALRALIYEHGAAGAPVLIKALSDTGELSAAGGARYIADIADIAPATIAEISVCAKEIKRTADLWDAYETAAALSARLSQPGMNATAADIIAEFSPRFSDIGANSAIGERRLIDYTDITPTPAADKPKIESRITALDSELGGGFFCGKIYAIGGGSGAGKTSLSLQIATAADNVLIIANDSAMDFLQELIAAQTGGAPNCEIKFLPDVRNAADCETVCKQWAARRYAKNANARLAIMIDMIQSLPHGETNARADISEKTAATMLCMRRIAESSRAVLLLNAAVRKEEHGGKNPTIESLRDGSDFGFKADAVLLIGNPRNENAPRERTLKIAKNRFAAAGGAPLNLTIGNNRRFAISGGAENATGAANGYAAAADKYGAPKDHAAAKDNGGKKRKYDFANI